MSLRLLLVQATFLPPDSYPPEVLEVYIFAWYISCVCFLIDGRYSDRVRPASNTPMCGVLAAESKTAASSHEYRNVQYNIRHPKTAAPSNRLGSLQSTSPSMLLSYRYIEKVVTQSSQSTYSLPVYFVHPPVRT